MIQESRIILIFALLRLLEQVRCGRLDVVVCPPERVDGPLAAEPHVRQQPDVRL